MIPEIAPYNNYTGDGSTTKFDFDFYIEDSTQLIVQLTQEDGTIQTLTNNTDYTIHEVGNKNGSYITFPVAGSSYSTLSSSEIISLSLSLPIAQESEYGTSSELDLVSLEYSLDYLTRICQIMNRQVVRALKVAEGSNINTDELALDVEKIADISDDVSTVAVIAADVTAVKNNATNISTVAGSIENVNAAGGSIANINTVAADLTNIDTVAGSISNVNTVGNNISSVNSVAGSIANVNAVKADLTNIDNVADDLTNIDAVAGNISSVNTVAAISSDVTAVKNNATNINAVAADLTNINAVAADLVNIDAASSNAQLAKDWANKMNGTVDGYEYSAKYYAQQAAAGQVQANWNESDTSSKAYIWNKPTIPDAQIQSDWEQTDSTKKDFIKNKPDLSLKQDKLVSGTNIKTINNNSILGSGDLTLDSLPSQTGNEGKFLTTDGTDASWAEVQSNGFNLFDIVMKDHILDFEESEGFSSLGTYVYKDAVAGSRYGYPDFYAKCLEEYQDANNTTETISNVTIIINANGHKFYDIADKTAIDTIYNNTGEAWFYGIDTTNERIFLPRDNEVMHGKLIESYTEGANWYRIYSDGWCEQGGKHTVTAGYGYYTINLLKPYLNTNYNIQLTAGLTDYDRSILYARPTLTTSSFQMYFSGSPGDTHTGDWQTSGYIDSNYESYKKPYIVVGNTAQTQAITDVTDITTSENDTLPLFTGMYFDYNPNNVGWLLSGEQANSGSIYTTAYNELVNELTLPKYNLKVIEEEDMVSGEDYSLYWIVNQTTETFRTPTKIQQRFVVKTYQNGTNWYRIYNDGWCEQGGRLSANRSLDYISGTITFLKPFKNTNYNIFISPTGASSSYVPIFVSRTNVSIGYQYVISYYGADWQACGYIDLTNETFNTSLYFKVANAVENLELLDAGEVMEALTDKADVDLSNINASCKALDGQWVQGIVTVAQNLSVSTTVQTFDLSNYLPDDNYYYEVSFSTGITGEGVAVNFYGVNSNVSQVIPAAIRCVGAGQTSIAGLKVIIGPNRELYIRTTSSTATVVGMSLSGYRRIGTNQ